MPSCASTSDWRPTSVTRTALGSEARTRTPTACCASTSPRAPTSATTAPATSPPSLLPSTADPARPSIGEPPQRPLMTSYTPANTAALRRPLEPGQDSSAHGHVPSHEVRHPGRRELGGPLYAAD